MCACDDIHGWGGMLCFSLWNVLFAVLNFYGGGRRRWWCKWLHLICYYNSHFLCHVLCVHVSHKLGEGMSTIESNLTSQSWIARSQKRQNYVLHSFVTLCEANAIKIYLYLSHCLVAFGNCVSNICSDSPWCTFSLRERRIEMNLPKPVQENYYFI